MESHAPMKVNQENPRIIASNSQITNLSKQFASFEIASKPKQTFPLPGYYTYQNVLNHLFVASLSSTKPVSEKTGKINLSCDVSKYDTLEMIGSGSYGEVFRACDSTDQQKAPVAIKRIKMDIFLDIYPYMIIREMHYLKQLRHQNIVHLIEICCEPKTLTYCKLSNICMVMEYCPHDLMGLLGNRSFTLKLEEIKGLAQQLLRGVSFMHRNRVLHRDLKPNNILVSNSGVIKIADLGMSRQMAVDESEHLHTRVTTLFYRSPEMLLGDEHYGSSVDMWSVALILYELWSRTTLLKGSTEQQQLDVIIAHLGTINHQDWPHSIYLTMRTWLNLKPNSYPALLGKLRRYIYCNSAVELIRSILVYNPAKRPSAEQVLQHEFFQEDPQPVSIGPRLADYNESMNSHQLQKRINETRKRALCTSDLTLINQEITKFSEHF